MRPYNKAMRDIVFKRVQRTDDARPHVLNSADSPGQSPAFFAPVISALPEPPKLEDQPELVKKHIPEPIKAPLVNPESTHKLDHSSSKLIKAKPRRIDRFFYQIEQGVNTLIKVLNGSNQPKVLTPALNTPANPKRSFFQMHKKGSLVFRSTKKAQSSKPVFSPHITPAKPSVGDKLKTKAQKRLAATKQSYCHAKDQLKHPIGKVAAINTIGILILVGYLAYSNNFKPQAAERNLANTVNQSVTLRQFQPIIPNVSKPEDPQQLTAFTNNRLDQSVWITPWNIQSYAKPEFAYSEVSAFWLTVASDGYSLESKADWTTWQDFAKAQADKLKTKYVTVSGDPNIISETITKPEAQTKLIQNLLQIVRDQQFDGVDLDFEGLGDSNRELYTNFVRNLKAAFDSYNKKVAVTLEARIANQVPMDWHSLGLIVDEVRIMAYDYHARETGKPGPVAPLGWLKEVTAYAIDNIDSNKIIIGLGNYGYDWTQKADGQGYEGIGLSYDRALSLSTEYSSPVVMATGIDERGYDVGLAPTFNYLSSDGIEHSVWFEDQNSLQLKVDLLNQYAIKSIIFWSVGVTDPKL